MAERLVTCGLPTDCARQPTAAQAGYALEQQAGVELALSFLAFRQVPYEPGLDVHEYLDKTLESIAADANYPRVQEQPQFTSACQYTSVSRNRRLPI